MSPDKELLRWRHPGTLFLCKVAEAELCPGGEDRVFGDQPLELLLHVIRQSIVGGPLVRKLRVPTDGGNLSGVQQRSTRGHMPKGTVGVPKTVAELKHPHPAVLVPDLVITGQVRDVREVHSE